MPFVADGALLLSEAVLPLLHQLWLPALHTPFLLHHCLVFVVTATQHTHGQWGVCTGTRTRVGRGIRALSVEMIGLTFALEYCQCGRPLSLQSITVTRSSAVTTTKYVTRLGL